MLSAGTISLSLIVVLVIAIAVAVLRTSIEPDEGDDWSRHAGPERDYH